MSFFSDLFSGVAQHGRDVFGGLKDNPFRALVGSADPFSTELWNTVLGRKDEPLVSMFGGTTDAQFDRMDARGMNTGPKRQVDGIADLIAGIFGMQGLGGAAGNMMGGGGSPPGGFMGQVDTGGVQGGGRIPGGFMGQVDTGGPMAGGNPFMDLLNRAPQGQGQQRQQAGPPPLPETPHAVRGPGSRVEELNRELREWHRKLAQIRAERAQAERGSVSRGVRQ